MTCLERSGMSATPTCASSTRAKIAGLFGSDSVAFPTPTPIFGKKVRAILPSMVSVRPVWRFTRSTIMGLYALGSKVAARYAPTASTIRTKTPTATPIHLTAFIPLQVSQGSGAVQGTGRLLGSTKRRAIVTPGQHGALNGSRRTGGIHDGTLGSGDHRHPRPGGRPASVAGARTDDREGRREENRRSVGYGEVLFGGEEERRRRLWKEVGA